MKETHHHYLRKIMTVLTANMEQPSRLLSPLSFFSFVSIFSQQSTSFQHYNLQMFSIFSPLPFFGEGG